MQVVMRTTLINNKSGKWWLLLRSQPRVKIRLIVDRVSEMKTKK